MAITLLDPKFKEEVVKLPGGQFLTRCFQCGTCNVECPVHEVNDVYNPRKILRMTLLGMRDRVLSSDFIWLCAQCYICQERCPQDVRIPEVMNAITNLAANAGFLQTTHAKQATTIGTQGVLHTVSAFENKRRGRRRLPELPSHQREIRELYRVTGLDKLLAMEAES